MLVKLYNRTLVFTRFYYVSFVVTWNISKTIRYIDKLCLVILTKKCTSKIMFQSLGNIQYRLIGGPKTSYSADFGIKKTRTFLVRTEKKDKMHNKTYTLN